MPADQAVLCQIARIIADSKLPVIFKGALITKSVLEENNFTAYDRQTNDIDGCWAGPEPAMKELASLLNDAFAGSGRPYRAEIGRNFGPDRTAMFCILGLENHSKNREI